MVIAINYSPEPREIALEIAKPWTIAEIYRGREGTSEAGATATLRLPPNAAAVLLVTATPPR